MQIEGQINRICRNSIREIWDMLKRFNTNENGGPKGERREKEQE